MITPFKMESVAEKFDRFVAFGGYGVSGFVDKEVLLNCDLISDEDKSALKDYTIANEINGGAFNLYLGVKAGKDIVELHHMSSPYKTFTFELKLDYRLESIISEFEQMSGETLRKEFLNGRRLDAMKKETSGIMIDFKILDDETYGHYYKTILNGKVYIINK